MRRDADTDGSGQTNSGASVTYSRCSWTRCIGSPMRRREAASLKIFLNGFFALFRIRSVGRFHRNEGGEQIDGAFKWGGCPT